MTYPFISATPSKSGKQIVIKFEGAAPVRTTRSYPYLVVVAFKPETTWCCKTSTCIPYEGPAKVNILKGTASLKVASARASRTRGAVLLTRQPSGEYRAS